MLYEAFDEVYAEIDQEKAFVVSLLTLSLDGSCDPYASDKL